MTRSPLDSTTTLTLFKASPPGLTPTVLFKAFSYINLSPSLVTLSGLRKTSLTVVFQSALLIVHLLLCSHPGLLPTCLVLTCLTPSSPKLTLLGGHIQANPNGSIQPTGLCTYPYRFTPPSNFRDPVSGTVPSHYHSNENGCSATPIRHLRTDPQNVSCNSVYRHCLPLLPRWKLGFSGE